MTNQVKAYLMNIVGACFCAFALSGFLFPNKIFSDGLIGLGMYAGYFSGYSFSIIFIVLNIPFLAFAFIKLRKEYFYKSLVSIVVLVLLLNLFGNVKNLSNDSVLAILFAGVFLGLGEGIIRRNGSTINGVELLVTYLSKKYNLPSGPFLFTFNLLVYALAGVTYGYDKAIYSLVVFFIAEFTANYVLQGFDNTKHITIISNKTGEIKEAIKTNMDRDTIVMNVNGMNCLNCFISGIEVKELKELVKEVDENAFIAVENSSISVDKY